MATRQRDNDEAGPSRKVVGIEVRQPRSYGDAVRSSTFGVQLQDRLGGVALQQCQAFKSGSRKLHKLTANKAAFEAEFAAGKLPSSLGPAALHSTAHTGFADLDSEVAAAASEKYKQLQDEMAQLVKVTKQAAIDRLSASLQELKTVTGPAALSTAFDSVVAGSAHAQDVEVQQQLQEAKKLLELELCAIENQLREGAATREAARLSVVEQRLQHQQRRQQRQQATGDSAAAIIEAAVAAGAAAAVSAVAEAAPPPPQPGQAPAAATGATDGDAEMTDTQDMNPNQEQQHQVERQRAAARNAITANQLAAAVQSAMTVAMQQMAQQGLFAAAPTPPATPPRPQQQRRGRRQQQQGRQQQGRQQQRNPRAPTGQGPRQPTPPGSRAPQQQQQQQHRRQPPRQQQQPRRARPNAAAGQGNANGSNRRTGNGGNSGRQARQPSR